MSRKSVIITGGAAGLGAGIAQTFAAEGYRVGVLDLDPATTAAAAQALPDAVALVADVTDEGAVQAAFDAFGTPDVLVNNAGILSLGALIDQSPAQFRKVLEVHVMGTFTCARIAARALRDAGRGGAIVNMTSINAVTPGPGSGAYPAAKAAIAKLTEHMAVEWGPLGIRVNCVAPGFIDGGMSAPFYADPRVRAVRGGAVPFGGLGLVADIAEAVWYLASDRARYVNGHQLVVDGGVTHSLLRALPRE
ncbi:MAG: SDR family oxidoreductase [Rhodobacter sp.]|uniref:SDR family NAD(P)-dependent oxidoreductase n=1 Tax=Pararhodobacter sp. TaxID=2127056 RepID=UPI001E0A4239|nr:SDR family oxidoreductase [Pararhodobacter sp.]MCB1346713.1 SDR family oxidoreductase [Paracoccaceae bacterium]MCC0074448.1 SDR family oxidoreductase [Rhodobacter sp.]HPD93180.1 SDR family oxidoreductase [Pararhodobacter sp.]